MIHLDTEAHKEKSTFHFIAQWNLYNVESSLNILLNPVCCVYLYLFEKIINQQRPTINAIVVSSIPIRRHLLLPRSG